MITFIYDDVSEIECIDERSRNYGRCFRYGEIFKFN